jgi:hypothetical protein
MYTLGTIPVWECACELQYACGFLSTAMGPLNVEVDGCSYNSNAPNGASLH